MSICFILSIFQILNAAEYITLQAASPCDDSENCEECFGQYFDLYAINDLVINTISWECNASSPSTDDYKLYIHEGESYKGYETEQSQWTLVCEGHAVCNLIGNDYIGKTASCNVTMSAGDTIGFYLHLNQGTMCRWNYTLTEVVVYSQDTNLKISTGSAASEELFGDDYSDLISVLAGSITYTPESISSTTDTLTRRMPSDGINSNIDITYVFKNLTPQNKEWILDNDKTEAVDHIAEQLGAYYYDVSVFGTESLDAGYDDYYIVVNRINEIPVCDLAEHAHTEHFDSDVMYFECSIKCKHENGEYFITASNDPQWVSEATDDFRQSMNNPVLDFSVDCIYDLEWEQSADEDDWDDDDDDHVHHNFGSDEEGGDEYEHHCSWCLEIIPLGVVTMLVCVILSAAFCCRKKQQLRKSVAMSNLELIEEEIEASDEIKRLDETNGSKV